MWILFALFFGGLVSGILLFKQQQFHESQKLVLEKVLQQQVVLEESIKKGRLAVLMNNVLDKVDEELERNSDRKLTEETIARIAALSYSFEPYNYKEGDSLTTKKYSPERGQLLLALVNMKMDSSSFRKIKLKTSFSGAALSGANLEGFDLSRIDLKGANLREADLRGINLSEADLMEANLWGANMRAANLKGASLRRANMAWVNLKDGVIRDAVMTGMDMTSAKLGGLDFRGVDLRVSDLSYSFLNGANLTEVKMEGAFFRKANLTAADFSNASVRNTDLKLAVLKDANFSGADLSGSDLSQANLSQANFTGVELYKVTFEEKKWFDVLQKWQVKGVENLGEKYEISKDLSKFSNYWLLPIQNK